MNNDLYEKLDGFLVNFESSLDKELDLLLENVKKKHEKSHKAWEKACDEREKYVIKTYEKRKKKRVPVWLVNKVPKRIEKSHESAIKRHTTARTHYFWLESTVKDFKEKGIGAFTSFSSITKTIYYPKLAKTKNIIDIESKCHQYLQDDLEAAKYIDEKDIIMTINKLFESKKDKFYNLLK